MRSKFKWIFTLLVAFTMQFSFAQEKTVTGVVNDGKTALPGANVLVKGTKNGVSTDFDGKFAVKAKAGDVLLVSFTGYDTQSVTVGAANSYTVKLKESATKLDEVLVSGSVGIKKKKDAVTSASQVVSAKELSVAANPDPVRSLIGKVSGLTINATTNGVNGDNAIRVRSMVSLTGNTEALVVIDDVISSASVFSSLPAEAIQNVTVLKGAQGAALYGSQGKSGVVIVATKKGSAKNKMEVKFTSSVDFENINFVPNRQTQYGQGWYGGWDQQENGGWGPLFDGAILPVGITLPDGTDVMAPYSSLGEDSIKDFYQTGTIFQNGLSFGLTGDNSYFNLNLNNLKRDFILPGDNFNRNTVFLSAGKKINKVSFGGNLTYINHRVKQANVNSATSRSDYTLLTNLLQTASNIPISEFEDRGLYGWNGYYQNPYWARDNNRLFEDRNFFNFAITTKYDMTKHISLSQNSSVQVDSRNQISYANKAVAPDNSLSDFSSTDSFYQSDFNSTYFYGDYVANFNYDLTKDIGLKANLGQNFQYTKTNRISQGGKNLFVPGWYNIQNVLNPDQPSDLRNSGVRQNMTATFLNVDLNYKDYLFLNLTDRYEGNSVGKKGDQFANYPSAGVSFIPTKAFSSITGNKLSSMKIYGNYTKIGSLDPINPHETLFLGELANNYPYPNGSGLSFTDEYTLLENIKPETYTTKEIGVNLGLFNDVISLDASYYVTDTKNLINRTPLSSTSGLSAKYTNDGVLKAKGYEVDLGYSFFKSKNFKWNGRLSYTSYDTKVVSAGSSSSIVIFNGGNAGPDFNIVGLEGESFPAITGSDWVRDGSGNVIVNATTGMPTVDNRFKYLGKATPDYILGWTNTFEYKGFGLSFTADYRTGHSFISQTKYNLTWNGHLTESGELDRYNGWILPNSVYNDPATPGVVDYVQNTSVLTGGFYETPGAANRTQTYWGLASQLGSHNLIDATALKIREIAFSYSLTPNSLKSIGLASLKFSINARNPFVFLADGKLINPKNGTANRGYADPEAVSGYNGSTSTAASQAGGTLTNTARNGVGFIGDGQYPSTRTFGFTLNASF